MPQIPDHTYSLNRPLENGAPDRTRTGGPRLRRPNVLEWQGDDRLSMAVISIAIASLKIREVLGRFSQSSREHHVADVITRELRDVTPDDERWAAKFKVLKARAPS